MIMQLNLIRKLILYEFEPSRDPAEATKNICCVKGESTDGCSTVIRYFKEFSSSYKKFDDQARLGTPPFGFQGHSPNHRATLISRTRRVLGELSILTVV